MDSALLSVKFAFRDASLHQQWKMCQGFFLQDMDDIAGFGSSMHIGLLGKAVSVCRVALAIDQLFDRELHRNQLRIDALQHGQL